jgi:zinc protease
VYFVESRVLPMLDVQVDFAAGSMFDPAGKSGLAALTRQPRSRRRQTDETAIAEQLADIGANLGGGADTDRSSVSIRTLSARESATQRWKPCAPSFSNRVLMLPSSSAKSAHHCRAQGSHDPPASIAGKAFWAALYPTHPYGQQATPESVAAMTRDDLVALPCPLLHGGQRQHHAGRRYFTQRSRKNRREPGCRAAQGRSRDPADAPRRPKGSDVKLPHPASQAHVYIGLPAIERGNPDFFPLVVGNYTLGGGGFVSRLMKEVRDKRGYAYSVYQLLRPDAPTGPFQIGLQTKRSQAKDAIKVTREVLDGFVKDRPERGGTGRCQSQSDRQLSAAPRQQQKAPRQRA